jgi:hypothetical protein
MYRICERQLPLGAAAPRVLDRFVSSRSGSQAPAGYQHPQACPDECAGKATYVQLPILESVLQWSNSHWLLACDDADAVDIPIPFVIGACEQLQPKPHSGERCDSLPQ